jgi:phage replication O-like protein O
VPIDCENGFTRLANGLIEELAKIRIPGEAMQVLWVIIRKTYGFNKKKDKIPLSQFVDLTGVPRSSVCRAIKKLVGMNLVFVSDNKVTTSGNKVTSLTTEYGINKEVELWQGVVTKKRLPVTLLSQGSYNIVNKPSDEKVTLKRHIQKTISKDNSTPKKSKPKSETSEIPESLQTDEFIAAWQEWIQHKTEIKNKMTPLAAKKALKKMCGWSASRAIAAIEYSIEKGWKGIYEDKNAPKDDERTLHWWEDDSIIPLPSPEELQIAENEHWNNLTPEQRQAELDNRAYLKQLSEERKRKAASQP